MFGPVSNSFQAPVSRTLNGLEGSKEVGSNAASANDPPLPDFSGHDGDLIAKQGKQRLSPIATLPAAASPRTYFFFDHVAQFVLVLEGSNVSPRRRKVAGIDV